MNNYFFNYPALQLIRTNEISTQVLFLVYHQLKPDLSIFILVSYRKLKFTAAANPAGYPYDGPRRVDKKHLTKQPKKKKAKKEIINH